MRLALPLQARLPGGKPGRLTYSIPRTLHAGRAGTGLPTSADRSKATSTRSLLQLDLRWQDIRFGGNDNVIGQDWPVHSEDGCHERHIIVAPDASVIVDDVGWNADDPKRDVHTDVFVPILHELDLPCLRFGFRRRFCWLRFFTCLRSSLGVFGSAGEKNSTYRIVLQVVLERV